jgi:hypothetical protein
VIVTESNGKVIFDVFCNFEENMQNLHKIFVEEAEFLFGSKRVTNTDNQEAISAPESNKSKQGMAEKVDDISV